MELSENRVPSAPNARHELAEVNASAVPQSSTPAKPQTAVQVRNLRKVFTSKHLQPVCVLAGACFSASVGEIVGIFGPSGCGKTTLLRILCGVLPYEGDVLLLGHDARTDRGAVAYVPQRAELLYWKTLTANALLGWSLSQRKIFSRANEQARARASALFERFRVSHPERKYPLQSSGGEKQRTAIIRALLSTAPILALDEPVGAVDQIARAEIYQTLLELVQEDRENKKTVLIVSHDPEELLVLCDRVLVIPKIGTKAMEEITVPFPRPRSPELKFDREFVGLKRHLWGLLQ
jgi:ABC-type nitrate/sulfonate/bicarbonate transport system ATPase subunit